MKKFLIALPLVLIMIMTMIPVLADKPAEPAPAKDPEKQDMQISWKVYDDFLKYNADEKKAPTNMELVTDVEYKKISTEAEAEKFVKAWLTEKFPNNVFQKVTIKAATADAKGEAFYAVIGKCIVDPTKPTEAEKCPVLCGKIKIQAIDVVAGKVIEAKVYGVNKKVAPNYKGMIDHFMATFFPGNKYQVVSNWFGQPWVELPAIIDNDCTITIKVLPKFVPVNVVHKLYNCCKQIDGKVDYELYKTFIEKNQVVGFFDYHTQLMVDHSKAAEFAQTRLQKLNAMDFVFIKAVFDDGIRLNNYMTGDVYDMDGKILVDKVVNTLPTIELIYHRAECEEKAEEKVDNATVENNNATTAPATNSGTQLPATGAKDVTAFFLSAVALLGLGIFFAKKH